GPVPELYVRELNTWPTVHKASDGEEVFPGITAHLAPGHTPGCMVFVLHAGERDVIFAGDASKNRAEMISGTTDMTYDAAVSRASIEADLEIMAQTARQYSGAGPRCADDAGRWQAEIPRQARSRHPRLVWRRHGNNDTVQADGVNTEKAGSSCGKQLRHRSWCRRTTPRSSRKFPRCVPRLRRYRW